MILSLFKKNPQLDNAVSLYRTAVDKARMPVFYEHWQVPDSFEGRFEMVTLHVYLIIRRLKQGDEGSKAGREAVSQHLFDSMFRNMDDTLREMGVGDLSVARKVRVMAEAFYGRAGIYEKALDHDDDQDLVAALSRNIYGEEDGVINSSASHLAVYVRSVIVDLEGQPSGRIVSGIIRFPEISRQRDVL